MTTSVLRRDGIARIRDGVLPAADLTVINTALDDAFREQADANRGYVTAADLLQRGLLGIVLQPGVRSILHELVPTPKISHCHVYETAAHQQRSHVHGSQPQGWHRDDETVHAHRTGELRFVCLFVYLSEVGVGDGEFEIVPADPETGLRRSRPVVSMTGPPGTSFAWQRSYWHRASPNTGARRRRLLKISIQPAAEYNPRADAPEFAEVARAARRSGDAELLSLFDAAAPPVGPAVRVPFELDAVAASRSVEFSRLDESRARARVAAASLHATLRAAQTELRHRVRAV